MTTPESFAPETPQTETWEDRMWDKIQDQVNRPAPIDAEAGFIALSLVGLVTKPLRRALLGSPDRAIATSVSTTLLVTTLAGGFIVSREIHGGADLDKAKTSSESKALVFNKKQELKIADFYFKEKFTARDIPYNIDWKPVLIDVIPNYKESKELNGVGKCSYTLPFTAVTPAFNEATRKTDYTVDKKQLKINCSWVEPPVIKDFEMDGNKRKYNANSLMSNTVKNISENFTHFRINNFKNAVNDIDLLAERAITNKALEVSGQKCSSELGTHLETAAEDALVANVESLGQKGESVGVAKFTEGQWVLTKDEVPPVVQAAVNDTYEHNRNIVVKQNYTVDEIKCDAKDVQVQ
ncbi:MAG: hypothetical protein ABIR37_00075 [Candidatus Saccharimonadales bacterium]